MFDFRIDPNTVFEEDHEYYPDSPTPKRHCKIIHILYTLSFSVVWFPNDYFEPSHFYLKFTLHSLSSNKNI